MQQFSLFLFCDGSSEDKRTWSYDENVCLEGTNIVDSRKDTFPLAFDFAEECENVDIFGCSG